jgi:hypothetical protein
MSEISTTTTPEVENHSSLEELFNQLLTLEPRPISNFVPTNAAEQKALFMSGDIQNPDHVYEKLDAIDFEANREKIRIIGDQIVAHPDVPPKYIDAYMQFVQRYEDVTSFMELAQRYKNANDTDKPAVRDEYMKKNIELYGQPDETTYRSLLSERLSSIRDKELSDEQSVIRDELFAIVDSENLQKTERFRPSDETVEWLQDVTVGQEGLFEGPLRHVPEQASFTSDEIKAIFEEILIVEFGEILRDEDNGILEGWKVVIEDAAKINVKSAEKTIVIPADRDLEIEEMKDRIVHELGIHYLRSVMGEQTDLFIFRLGLSEYLETEEGLGVVMEQARVGKYREAGIDHYITAGLAQFEGKDFREIYEIKWRIDLLADIEAGPKNKSVSKSQDLAYTNTTRFFRGTDDLPWFKDLSYYNGSAEVWKHFEAIKGNYIEFMLVLLGKANAGDPAHRRTMLETATV